MSLVEQGSCAWPSNITHERSRSCKANGVAYFSHDKTKSFEDLVIHSMGGLRNVSNQKMSSLLIGEERKNETRRSSILTANISIDNSAAVE